MGLFSKKALKTVQPCTCGDHAEAPCAQEACATPSGDHSVKVLGSGCDKCMALEASTRAALQQLGMEAEIDHVRDFAQIAAYGVMTTPALVVDGKVVSFGKVLKTEEVVNILKKVRG